MIFIIRCDGAPACEGNQSPSCILDSSGPIYGTVVSPAHEAESIDCHIQS